MIGGVSALVGASDASDPFIFSINAARAAACAGLSCAWTEMKLAQTVAAQMVNRNLETCIVFFYAKSASDATAFRPVENRFRHAPGNGQASNDWKMRRFTSPRDTFTRCCNSITLAARNFLIVFMPIKIGHAHARRTRNCEDGILFV